ncbi:uncharacterized protein LOC131852162 [Achroia grisella]|uniref:uncharacterized protein LOC131852162 n=1 Tax=Achroia grisella TaxID=688607 RepID=UPI0027D26724|nr:uncharacterized protein LOC131852162 [Achroia grisella]
MEINKENRVEVDSKIISKIPLPIHPLPALPKHLVKEKMHSKKNIVNERHPLRTLNSQSLELPGPSKPLRKNIDSRHVTLRQRKEELDWDYKVFKDDVLNNSIIIISESDEENDKEYFVGTRKKNDASEIRGAITPTSKSLEPSRVKKIKRSLKRPHSKELQGISPAEEHKRGEEKHKRQLYFYEQTEKRLSSPDFLTKSYMNILNKDYTTDIFTYLLNTEHKPIAPRILNVTRACVVNWLMKVNGAKGNPATIQIACWYLDSILSTGQIHVDKLQLIAAACYWIAQKLNGPVLSASRLVRFSSNAFTAKDLMAAEKAVLERLKFPRQPVVAQEYITYFSWWCNSNCPGKIEMAATFLCMSGILVDNSLCNICPSVVGAAAVKNAVYLLKNPALLARLQLCPVFKAAEQKAGNLSHTSSILRRAVRHLASPMYEYKVPLEHYGTPPHYIAQRIIKAIKELYESYTKV